MMYRRQHLTLLLILLSYTTSSICATSTQSQQQKDERAQSEIHKTNSTTPPLPNEWLLDRNHYSGALIPPGIQRRTCVIVQDSAPGPEVEVLDATSRVNRAYAKRWGHDYLKFTGVALGSKPWQATFNKPFLLSSLLMARVAQSSGEQQRSLQRMDGEYGDEGSTGVTGIEHSLQGMNDNKGFTFTSGSLTEITTAGTRSLQTIQNKNSLQPYDTVLFLDSNAMIVQLDYDVLDLIARDKMLAMVGGTGDQIHRSKYSDVMIWNLAHPQALNVSDSWIEKSQTSLHDENANSQTLLMNVLHNEAHQLNGSDRTDLLDLIPEPMVDGLQGTVIKQDSKYTTQVVEQSDLPQIMPVVQGIADSVCYRFYPQCEVV